MHIPALVFSRMDSSRLPGKALKPLAGAPVLARVLHRLSHAREIDGIVVCTSARVVDDPIAAFADKMHMGLFRGATDDVLGRALAAAAYLKADAVVRISGDSPFMDPALVDVLVTQHRAGTPDITTNVHPRSYPAGMSVEVIATATLEKLDGTVTDPAEREHVTQHLYRNSSAFRIENVAAPDNLGDVDLALDTDDDFVFQSWLAAEVAADAALDTIVEAARRYRAHEKENAT
jgi:spore coat polysaccharide biosynthesis protein SpsF